MVLDVLWGRCHAPTALSLRQQSGVSIAALPTTGDGMALEEVGESGRDLAGMGQRQRVIRPGHRDVLGV